MIRSEIRPSHISSGLTYWKKIADTIKNKQESDRKGGRERDNVNIVRRERERVDTKAQSEREKAYTSHGQTLVNKKPGPIVQL